MSHLLGVLRAGDQTTPLAPAPGLPEIAGLVAQAREAGMRVAQTVHGAARPVPGGLSLAAYRIVQEALTNVRKHAGPGATTRVTLRYGTGELVVRVEDDGGPLAAPDRLPRYGAAARPPAAPGHGLAEMRVISRRARPPVSSSGASSPYSSTRVAASAVEIICGK